MTMMGYQSPPLALTSAIIVASALNLVSSFQSMSNQCSPTPALYQMTASTTALCAWNRELNSSGGGGLEGGGSRSKRRQQRPLRAYTVADNIGKPSWFPFFKFPLPFADVAAQFFGLEDSLFSFEGGGATGIATRPYMPNLELEEEAATVASIQQGSSISNVINNDVILSELDALTETFADLESSMDYRTQLYEKTIQSYEYKVTALEAKNKMLEEGLQRLTVALDQQEKQLFEMRQNRYAANVAEADKKFDVDFLLQVQGNVQILEDENSNLRQRVRALELELSEAAFASRKHMSAPIVVVSPSSTVTSVTEASVSIANNIKLSPKAPSVPVPPHILQQQLVHLHRYSDESKQQRSSIVNSVGRGLRKGIHKVGQAFNLWNPGHNLMLWGELKGY